jgi:hypothetical protein
MIGWYVSYSSLLHPQEALLTISTGLWSKAGTACRVTAQPYWAVRAEGATKLNLGKLSMLLSGLERFHI